MNSPYDEIDKLIEKELIPYGITIENAAENADRVRIVELQNPDTFYADDAIALTRHDFYVDGAYAFSVEYRVVWDTIAEGTYSTKSEYRIVKKGEDHDPD